MHFVIHFLYISLSASINSKVPKTKSCLFVDTEYSTKLSCEILFGEKEHCNKLCLYSVFYTGVILTPWYS